MASCVSCLGLKTESFPRDADPDMFKPGTKELSTTSAQLTSTRDKGCESCYVILEAIQRCGKDVADSSDDPWDISSPCAIRLRLLDEDIWSLEATWDIHNKKFQGRKPNIEVELYSESRESSLFSHLGTAQKAPLKLSSDECADISNVWISECKSHRECPKPEETILPKRVIDVRGFTQNKSVALLETTTGQKGYYIALSHCWGSESFIQTTKSTLQPRKTCIEWSELPLTFQDTVTLARRMGLQYIWIDSLCIIQDDRLDWEIESAVMANVYSNAYITLAATGPAGNGCFFERWANPSMLNWGIKVPIHSHEIRSLKNPNLKIFARMRLDKTFNDFTAGVTIGILEDAAPLLSRAWVFQERFLSPRVLYFHPSSLVWECGSALYLESYALEDFSAQRTESDVPVRVKQLFSKIHSPSTTSVTEAHNLWLTLVAEYSRLRLTYESDRLPALSGVATRLQEFMSAKGIRNEKYLAGIWRSDLVRSLIWAISEGVTRRSTKPCPPSWSWASIEGLGGNTMITFRHDYIYHGDGNRERDFVPNPRLRVLDVSCELAGINAFGHVSRGVLRLVADTVEAVISYRQKSARVLSFYSNAKTAPLDVVLIFQTNVEDDWVLVETEIVWKDLALYVEDGADFVNPGTTVKCLLVGRANDYSGVVNMAIVLKEADENDIGNFERIGLLVCKVEKLRAFLDAKETELSIV